MDSGDFDPPAPVAEAPFAEAAGEMGVGAEEATGGEEEEEDGEEVGVEEREEGVGLVDSGRVSFWASTVLGEDFGRGLVLEFFGSEDGNILLFSLLLLAWCDVVVMWLSCGVCCVFSCPRNQTQKVELFWLSVFWLSWGLWVVHLLPSFLLENESHPHPSHP